MILLAYPVTVNGTGVFTAHTSSSQAASIAPRHERRSALATAMNEVSEYLSGWVIGGVITNDGQGAFITTPMIDAGGPRGFVVSGRASNQDPFHLV